ncbi:MAG TPA: glycosyltransferase [Thermoanaerobaculia bacterium]
MISVTHLITTLETGGAEMMLARLVPALSAKEFRSRVVVMVPGGRAQDLLAAAGVPVVSLGMRRGRWNPFAVLPLVRELRRNRPEILQTWLYHADLLGLIAGRLAGVRSILWNVRNSEIDRAARGTRLVRRLLRGLSSWPEAIVSNSDSAMRFHAGYGYAARRWVVIPNGFDVDRFRPDPESRLRVRESLGIPAAALVVGTVGRSDPLKDHPAFLSAACSVLRKLPGTELHFLVAGAGMTEESPLAAALPEACRRRIHFLGERADVAGIMAAMDVFTLTSVAEGFPNVVGEAMACGVPCVVTDAGDAAKIAGAAGIVVPPGSPERVEAAWLRLLENPEERRARGEASRKRIVDEYALGSVVARYEALYREIAGASGEPQVAEMSSRA